MSVRSTAAAMALAVALMVPAAGAAAPVSPQQTPPPASAPTIRSPLDVQSDAQQIADSKTYIQEQQLQLQLDTLRVARARAIDRHELLTLYKQSVFDVIITLLVFSITLAGVWMSYRQFEADLRANRDGPSNTFKASAAGVEISSSVIGLLVLVVSLAFFYLYVKEVYPITVISRPAPPAAAPPAAAPPAAAPKAP